MGTVHAGRHAAPIQPVDAGDFGDARALIQLVHDRCGISLGEHKRELIGARLGKRLHRLGLRTYAEYVRHVERDGTGEELTILIDAITTNHTSFFREPQHFTLLAERVLPELAARRTGPLTGWSAACSSGEEPYTIAVAALEAGYHQVRLLASDISTRVLAKARQGVYPLERVEGLPRDLLKRHFEKGLGAQDGLARVAAPVRQMVEFRALNLLEITSLNRSFDFIFCRNVMIYFDKSTQQRVVAMLERHLSPGGYLFIAHSESLNGVRHGLQWVAPAVYRRRV